MEHLGSTVEPPDLDYVAWVEVLGGSLCVELDDPDNILTWMPLGTPVDATLPYMNSDVLPESFDDERAWLHTLRADLDMDANRDGVVDSDETGPDDVDEDVWEYGAATTGAVILCNNDDDNDDGIIDSTNDVVDGPNDVADLAPIVIRRLGADVPEGWTVRLTVETNGDKVRIFDALDPSATAIITPTESTYDIPPEDIGGSGAPLTYGIEATEYPGWPDETFDGLVTISLSILNPAGAVQCEDRVQARVAPWLMPSHLDLVSTVFVGNAFGPRVAGTYQGGPSNAPAAPSLVGRLTTALASTGITPTQINTGGPWIPLCGNTGDPWIQDQIEVGFHSAPGYGWNPVVLNSPRDRTLGCFFVDGADFRVPGLTLFAETQLLGPDFGFVGTIGGIDTTQDSFGNLEAFGPLFNHPVGLIYHGDGLQAPIQTFLNQQAVQAPTPDGVIDTSWLLVQHVDEIVSIDAFNNIAYVANPLLGMIILILEDPAYEFDQGQLWNPVEVQSVSELLSEYGALNDVADNQIQAVRDRLNDLGYQVISIPVFFFEREGFPGLSTAAFPNMVNMLNVDGTLIVPEPFYQPFKDALLDAVLPGTPVEWIDCLEVHWVDGEVHCATGTIRWPSEEILQWWLHEPAN